MNWSENTTTDREIQINWLIEWTDQKMKQLIENTKSIDWSDEPIWK